jgi:hypothetical protein
MSLIKRQEVRDRGEQFQQAPILGIACILWV